MTPQDLIYREVYTRCLKEGISEFLSKDAALIALQKYKNNQFTRPSALIDESVKAAKGKHKKSKKK